MSSTSAPAVVSLVSRDEPTPSLTASPRRAAQTIGAPKKKKAKNGLTMITLIAFMVAMAEVAPWLGLGLELGLGLGLGLELGLGLGLGLALGFPARRATSSRRTRR